MFNNVMVETSFNMWFSKDVPLSGLERVDTTASNIATKVELTGGRPFWVPRF
jgi:hypothetical protein